MLRPLWILLLLLAFGSASADDWPVFRGSNHDGISAEKNWMGPWPAGQPKVLWKKSVGTGYSSMSVASGRVYTLGNAANTDTLYCFEAGSGGENWKFSYAQKLDPKYYEGGPSSTPTVSDGMVYWISKQGEVFCFDASSGREIWRRQVKRELGLADPEWGFAGSALVEGEVVYFNAGTHGIALNRRTGDTVWVSGTAASGYSSMVPLTFAGGRALAVFAAKNLVVVDPVTGKALAQFPWETMYDVNAPDPVLAGGDLLITSGYKFLEKPGTGASAALLRTAGGRLEKVWQTRELASQLSTPVYLEGHFYGVTGNGDEPSFLRCLDARTGEVRWSSPQASMGNLMVADGRVIWVAGNGELIVVAARPDSYRELARAQVTGGKVWSAPVLSNGRLYVRSVKGDLTCVDVKGTGSMN